jgi:glycosyltransferase involved in cell wall biosynthesis
MMAARGYEVFHYGVGLPDSTGWKDCIEVISPELQCDLLGYDPTQPGPEFIGRGANVSSPAYQVFNQRVRGLLRSNLQPDDIIALPFGHAHEAGIEGMRAQAVETGIGYPTCFLPYRIYESSAWMHWHLGRENRNPQINEWVVPNYFDPEEWPMRPDFPTEGKYVLYFGRINHIKGLDIVWNLARERRDLQFVICGQGDPAPWLKDQPNIHYNPPVHGADRARLFHRARVVLMPTQYAEPFGGVAVEAMLTGTPVVASDSGAFRETIDCWRCRPHTKAEWLAALESAPKRSPMKLRERALRAYSMEAVGHQYDRIFQSIPGLRKHGWNGESTGA